MAKAVLLKDIDGYVLAVVPATHMVWIGELDSRLGRDLETASEDDLDYVFSDCETGAVPALGPAYDLDTVVDHSLCGQRMSTSREAIMKSWFMSPAKTSKNC